MKTRPLGKTGLVVPVQGLGCMGAANGRGDIIRCGRRPASTPFPQDHTAREGVNALSRPAIPLRATSGRQSEAKLTSRGPPCVLDPPHITPPASLLVRIRGSGSLAR